MSGQPSERLRSVEHAESVLRRVRNPKPSAPTAAVTFPTSAQPTDGNAECAICSGPLRGKARFIDPHGMFCGSCAYGFFCWKRGRKWLTTVHD